MDSKYSRSTSQRAHGEQKIHERKDDIAPVRLNIGQATLQKNIGVVSDDRIDPGSRIAEQNDARQQKRDDVFAVQQRFFHSWSRRGLDLRGRESLFHLV